MLDHSLLCRARYVADNQLHALATQSSSSSSRSSASYASPPGFHAVSQPDRQQHRAVSAAPASNTISGVSDISLKQQSKLGPQGRSLLGDTSTRASATAPGSVHAAADSRLERPKTASQLPDAEAQRGAARLFRSAHSSSSSSKITAAAPAALSSANATPLSRRAAQFPSAAVHTASQPALPQADMMLPTLPAEVKQRAGKRAPKRMSEANSTPVQPRAHMVASQRPAASSATQETSVVEARSEPGESSVYHAQQTTSVSIEGHDMLLNNAHFELHQHLQARYA